MDVVFRCLGELIEKKAKPQPPKRIGYESDDLYRISLANIGYFSSKKSNKSLGAISNALASSISVSNVIFILPISNL